MRLTITRPGSVDYERVRWLIALWGKPGAAAVLGGGGAITPATGCFLLLESGGYLLLESGDKLELEGCATPTANLLLLESGDALLLESGDGLALEG